MKKLFTILLTIIMMFTISSCGSNGNTQNTMFTEIEETYSEFAWPTIGPATLLPKPKSDIGNISWDASYGFAVTMQGMSKDDFSDYVKLCQDNGFVVDYRSGDDFYYADNESGYSLILTYEDTGMFIRIDIPDSAENTEESTEVSLTETLEIEIDSTKSSNVNIRPEFKEAIDSYESLIIEYCDFMKKYNNSDDKTSMLSDYTNYVAQYVDTMAKISALNDGSLSSEELKYYSEANLRITQLLLEVSES